MVDRKSSFGHVCTGGGATIKDSPINIHIHIHANKATFTQKTIRGLCELFGYRTKTIENASQLSSKQLQRVISGQLEYRQS
jgi:hypothetical protein